MRLPRIFNQSLCLPFVDANAVAVGVKYHGHVADGRGRRLHAEFHVVRAEMGHGGVEVPDFQRDAAAVRAGLEARGGAEGQGVRPQFIFNPLAMFGIVGCGGLEPQRALIKFPRARHVGDGVTTEGNFGGVEHKSNFS